MKVREIMTSDVRQAAPETTLEEIACIMRDEDVGAVPVLIGRNLIGIVTDRDIVVRCVASQDDPADVTAEEIIEGELHTITPEDDVEEASRMMAEYRIRRLPVCENGELVGMLALADIAVCAPGSSAVILEGVSQGAKASHKADAVHSEGRQQAIQQEAGRRGSSSTSRHAKPSRTGTADEGDIDRSIEVDQSKVVPIQPEQKQIAKSKTKASGQRSKRGRFHKRVG